MLHTSDGEILPRYIQNYRFYICVSIPSPRDTHPAYDIEHFPKVVL